MPNFTHLDLGDLAFCFRAVCEEHADLWRATGTWLQLGGLAAEVRREVVAASDAARSPEVVRPTGGAILDEMRAQDARLRTLSAVLALTAGNERATAEIRAAAARLGAEIDPKTLARCRRATDRMAAAHALGAAREALSADLALVEGASGHAVAELLDAWLASAERLFALKTAPVAAPVRTSIGASRRRGMQLLATLRHHLSVEVAGRPELPRDLVAQVFGAVDGLAESRAQAKRLRRTPVASAPSVPRPVEAGADAARRHAG